MVAFSRIFLQGFSRFLFFLGLLNGGKIRVLRVVLLFLWGFWCLGEFMLEYVKTTGIRSQNSTF